MSAPEGLSAIVPGICLASETLMRRACGAWGEVTAALRSALSAIGWELDGEDNVSRVISPEGNVTVVAISGNECTGLQGKHEQLSTRRPRGSAGVRIIRSTRHPTAHQSRCKAEVPDLRLVE